MFTNSFLIEYFTKIDKYSKLYDNFLKHVTSGALRAFQNCI